MPDFVAVAPPAVPSPGQLVSIRQRRFVVTQVAQSSSGSVSSPLAPGPQHLLHLQSIDDDGLGKELSVVWKPDPGIQVLERSALPCPSLGLDAPLVRAVETPRVSLPIAEGVGLGKAIEAGLFVQELLAPYRKVSPGTPP